MRTMKENRIIITKSKHYIRIKNSPDVFISILRPGKRERRDRYSFRFNPNATTRIISEADYFSLAVDIEESRVYFVPSTKKEGYKVTCTKNNSYMKVPVDDKNILLNYTGPYDLKFSRSENCHYIDLRACSAND